MIHALKAISLTIGDLTSSPGNLRSNSPEECEIDAIVYSKASIGVLAGGRCCAAVSELVADKTAKGFIKKTKIEFRPMPDNYDVTTAMSFAENITQASMNAINEFEAFARMMEVDG